MRASNHEFGANRLPVTSSRRREKEGGQHAATGLCCVCEGAEHNRTIPRQRLELSRMGTINARD